MQEWVDAFKLKKITPLLDEMGAEGDEDVAAIMDLNTDEVQQLREALPSVKQRKFDKGLAALQQHKAWIRRRLQRCDFLNHYFWTRRV